MKEVKERGRACQRRRSMLRLSQAKPRQSREKAKAMLRRPRDEGALPPTRSAGEKESDSRNQQQHQHQRQVQSRWVVPQPREKKGHELEDEFEEREVNQKIMKRKENSQGMGPKDP